MADWARERWGALRWRWGVPTKYLTQSSLWSRSRCPFCVSFRVFVVEPADLLKALAVGLPRGVWARFRVGRIPSAPTEDQHTPACAGRSRRAHLGSARTRCSSKGGSDLGASEALALAYCGSGEGVDVYQAPARRDGNKRDELSRRRTRRAPPSPNSHPPMWRDPRTPLRPSDDKPRPEPGYGINRTRATLGVYSQRYAPRSQAGAP